MAGNPISACLLIANKAFQVHIAGDAPPWLSTCLALHSRTVLKCKGISCHSITHIKMVLAGAEGQDWHFIHHCSVCGWSGGSLCSLQPTAWSAAFSYVPALHADLSYHHIVAASLDFTVACLVFSLWPLLLEGACAQ